MIEVHINKLTIRNYRCITKVELDELTPITIFVGRNNTGKSTLLEAIALVSTARSGWCDSLGDDLLKPIIDRRGGMRYADMMVKIGKECAELKKESEDSVETVQIAASLDNLSDPLNDKIFSAVNEQLETFNSDLIHEIERQLAELRPTDRSFEPLEEVYRDVQVAAQMIWGEINLCIGYYPSNQDKIEYALIIGEKFLGNFMRRLRSRIFIDENIRRYGIRYPIGEIIRSSSEGKSDTIFLLTPTIDYLKELQRRLARTGDLLNVIERMKEKISYFQDIREVENDFLVFIKGLRRSVPLAAMGDGFRAKLAMLSAISTVKRGVALMEEPETRLHPGYMSSVIHEIASVAKQGNLQFFASTHSLEFLELLLEIKADLVKIVRMYRQESGEIDYEVLEGQEAKKDLRQFELDLRGV